MNCFTKVAHLLYYHKPIVMKSCLFAFLMMLIPFLGCGQENYKFSHPVSEYRGGSVHPVVDLSGFAPGLGSRPRNIILLIGDGMGVSQLYAGITANRGALNITQMPYVGFIMTHSANKYVTDSAAGGTALATGQKTNNGAIGVDVNGNTIPTILEIADSKGLHTGLVSTSAITHATPASFIAHVPSRGSYEDIATFFTGIGIDVFMGGGRLHFESRADGRHLSNELTSKGFRVVNALNDAIEAKTTPLAALVADEHIARYPERGDYLPLATAKSAELLSSNASGFFLMVEGSQIDWGGHQNDAIYVVDEMLDFDRAVGKALEFALRDQNTLVVVTADHETGAMSLINGDFETGGVRAVFASEDHSGVMVPVFAFGPGAERFMGVYHNTDIFLKMKEVWGF